MAERFLKTAVLKWMVSLQSIAPEVVECFGVVLLPRDAVLGQGKHRVTLGEDGPPAP